MQRCAIPFYGTLHGCAIPLLRHAMPCHEMKKKDVGKVADWQMARRAAYFTSITPMPKLHYTKHIYKSWKADKDDDDCDDEMKKKDVERLADWQMARTNNDTNLQLKEMASIKRWNDDCESEMKKKDVEGVADWQILYHTHA